MDSNVQDQCPHVFSASCVHVTRPGNLSWEKGLPKEYARPLVDAQPYAPGIDSNGDAALAADGLAPKEKAVASGAAARRRACGQLV